MAISIEVRDGIAYISFPLDNDEGLSSSGKTRIVASTHGNQQIGDTGVFMGLNAYRPAVAVTIDSMKQGQARIATG